MDNVRQFLSDIISERGLDMSKLSIAINKNHSYIQQFIKYNKPQSLSEDARRRLALELNIDERKLRTPLVGQFDPDVLDEIPDRDAGELDVADRAEKRRLRPGEIPEREIRAGMGIGGQELTVTVDGKTVDAVKAVWSFPVPFLHSELRAREPDLDIIYVDGDSMTPTLHSGDRVMVHKADQSPSPGGLFLIHDGIGPSVRRLHVVVGSSPIQIKIICDNQLHPSETILASDINIIGRVICKISRT